MHVSLLKGVQFLVHIYDVFYETAMIMETALTGRHLTSIVFKQFIVQLMHTNYKILRLLK